MTRQAKWALEIVDPDKEDITIVQRRNNFQRDHRLNKRFSPGLDVYKGSGYDRGHLVPSANQRDTKVENSETFLLSNMCPQVPAFNQKIWRRLEEAVRKLDADPDILETYVLTGPLFDFDVPWKMIGSADDYGLSIPVPTHFFKCVLVIKKNNKMKIWSFKMENADLDGDLGDYLVKTYDVEQWMGGRIWSGADGGLLHPQKRVPGTMWDIDP